MAENKKKPKHLEVCGDCGGDGFVPDLTKPKGTWYQYKTCDTCKGNGWVEQGVSHEETE